MASVTDFSATIPEAIDLLAILGKQRWIEDHRGNIRNLEGRCPICALVKLVDPRLDVYWLDAHGAWAALGCTGGTDFVNAVVYAADCEDAPYRKQLKFVLGMLS